MSWKTIGLIKRLNQKKMYLANKLFIENFWSIKKRGGNDRNILWKVTEGVKSFLGYND